MRWLKRKNVNKDIDDSSKDLLKSMLSYKNSIPLFNFEIERARRYEHALSIAVFRKKRPNETKNGSSANGSHGRDASSTSHSFAQAGTILRDHLRNTDVLAYDLTHNRFVLLLSNTAAQEASNASIRLCEIVRKEMKLDLSVGISQLGKHGFTLDHLVSHSDKNC